LTELASALGRDGMDQLTKLFLRESRLRVQRLRQAAGSPTIIRAEAHQLHGAGAAIGATGLATLAEQLGSAARAGDSDCVLVLTNGVGTELDRVAAFLEDWTMPE
jgi:HPt (histidine-containing phosphotransfer) domain-containing protein